MLGKGLESLIPKKITAPTPASDVPPSSSDRASGAPTREEPSSGAPNAHIKESAEKPLPRAHSRTTAEGNAVFHIETEKIKPNSLQPRRDFNEEHVKELAESIREFGIIQPLVVSKIETEIPSGTEVEYQLIAGERRLLAAKLLGLPRVPVIIRKIDAEKERLELAIIENLQRQDLNPVERARAFARLQDEFRLTQREIAARLGRSRETIANTLRLLDLPSYIQDAVGKGEISESHGRLLLAVTDAQAQEKLFRDLVDKHLTTRDLKNRLPAGRPTSEKEITSASLSSELLSLQEKLSSELGAPVTIVTHGDPPAHGGKITITYYSDEELKNIVERLGGDEREA